MTEEQIKKMLTKEPLYKNLYDDHTVTHVRTGCDVVRRKPKPGVCPVCNQEFGWKDSVTREEYVDYGMRGEGSKYVTPYEKPSYRVHKKCNDKLNTNFAIVILLTIALCGIFIVLPIYISTVTTDTVSIVCQGIAGFFGFIAGMGFIALVLFRSLILFEVVGNIFNIKWRVSDILNGF